MMGLEFYRNIPKKTCADCGASVEELADCYVSVCDSCLKNQDK